MAEPKSDQETCVEAAVTHFQKKVIGYLLARFRDLELAREAAQNSFLALARADCPEIENKEAWLITVSRNNALRTKGREKFKQDVAEHTWENLPDAMAASPADQAAAAERKIELLALLDALPERQREVMRLIYIAGLKPAAVAEMLQDKPNTVHQLHFTALAALRRRMKRSDN